MRLITSILLGLALCLTQSSYLYAKEIKLTTYYPSPYGEYAKLQSNESVSGKAAVGDFDGDGKFTNADLVAANVPAGGMAVLSSVKIGADTTNCTSTNAGAMRYNSTTNAIEACLETGTPLAWNWISAVGGATSKTGSFVGNGATKTISGIGFQPTAIFFYKNDGGHLLWKIGNGNCGSSDSGANGGSCLSFNADGFTLGNNAFNQNGETYYYQVSKDT